MKLEQLSFNLNEDTYSIGTKVKILGLSKEAVGIITRFSITKHWAYVSYIYKDDPLQQIQYAYFNVKKELRTI